MARRCQLVDPDIRRWKPWWLHGPPAEAGIADGRRSGWKRKEPRTRLDAPSSGSEVACDDGRVLRDGTGSRPGLNLHSGVRSNPSMSSEALDRAMLRGGLGEGSTAKVWNPAVAVFSGVDSQGVGSGCPGRRLMITGRGPRDRPAV